MELTKKKNFLVGVDSDGTVFDTMTIKHSLCFIPAAIEIFELTDCTEEYREIAERINLFSLSRGINRFPGLYLGLLELQKEGHVYFEGLETLKGYIDSDSPMSNAGLNEYLLSYPSPFLQKVLAWSKLGDSYFEKETRDIKPYDGVSDAVRLMQDFADIMVVSAASAKGLLKDFTNASLADKVNFIAGQEFGSKAAQLQYAKEKGYLPEQMLMIGDAPGDYEAAKKAGALFYPIIPGNEAACWQELSNQYLELFFSGKYSRDTENKLYHAFISVLQ